MSWGIALGIVSAGVSIYNVIDNKIQGNKSEKQQYENLQTQYEDTAFNYEQQSESLEEQSTEYMDKARFSRLSAGRYEENAAETLEHGQDIFEQSTEIFNTQKSQMRQGLGNIRMQVGASSVEMKGSARRLIAENAMKMNRDLKGIERTAQSTWRKLMTERRGSITSKWNLLQRADTQESIAGSLLDRSQSFSDRAEDYEILAEKMGEKADNVSSLGWKWNWDADSFLDRIGDALDFSNWDGFRLPSPNDGSEGWL